MSNIGQARFSARVFVIAPGPCVLLFHFREHRFGPLQEFWSTPGGQIDTGETAAEAAARELWEETGLDVPLDGPVLTRHAPLSHPDRYTHMDETYFRAVLSAKPTIAPQALGEVEKTILGPHRWWSAEELAVSDEVIYPPALAQLMRSILSWQKGSVVRHLTA